MNSGKNHNEEEAFYIAYLIAGYLRKDLTKEEHDALDAWVEASDENMKLFEDLTDESRVQSNLAWMDSLQTEEALHRTAAQIGFISAKKEKKPKRWWTYLVAGTLVAGVASMLVLRNSEAPQSDPTQQTASLSILPGGPRATLTFNDGTVIDLSTSQTGLIRHEHGAAVSKQAEGILLYAAEDKGMPVYHTLTTPRGGQYAVTLSDGTKVWLNAASSLRFPSRFDSGQRRVELSGEAYFELAKRNNQDFIVHLSNSSEVKVLGTAFNITSYEDEENQEITLVNGSVQITRHQQQLHLQPGQQASIAGNQMVLKKKVDVEAITAWKRGSFLFRNDDIKAIMKQVKRWYDINVVFQTEESEHFNATISRDEPLSKLLHYLELTGKIHFKIENRTVYVLP